MANLRAIMQICHAQYYFKYNLNWAISFFLFFKKGYSQYINAAFLEAHLGIGNPFPVFFKHKYNPHFNQIM